MGQRLDTRVSRLLLDEQALSPAALEEAVQHQVVYGGALDTILLETGALDEDRITGALSIAWSTTPVAREEWESPAKDAVARLPRRMAQTMGLCPFRVDDEGVHVLLAAPFHQELLDEVSALVSASLVPHVVPEVRLHQALHAAYGVPVEERMASLLHSLDHGKRMPPVRVGSSRDDDDDDDDTESKGMEREAREWSLKDALSQLAEQPSRDGISRVALAYARRFLPFAAIFGVRDDKAIGWSRTGHAEGAQFDHRPLDVPEGSLLEQVLQNPSPLLTKPPITDGNTTLFGWVGRRRPQTAVLIPIAVAGRTVAVLYADGGVRKKPPNALSDLVAFGARIGPSFEGLLRARHRAHADLFEQSTVAAAAARAALEDEEVPAPPPLDESVGARSSDGTSPFALGYAPTSEDIQVGRDAHAAEGRDDDDDVPAPPPAPELSVSDSLAADSHDGEEGEEDLRYDDVIEDEGPAAAGDLAAVDPTARVAVRNGVRSLPASLLAGADEPLDDDDDDDAPVAPPGPPVIFGEVMEGAKPANRAWRGALSDTVARGHQGGESDDEEPVLSGEDDDSWEDVVLDAANARQLAKGAAAPAKESPKIQSASRNSDDATQLSPELLVEQLESLHPRVVADAKERLIALGEEAVPALKAAFPGRMLMDPFAEKHPPEASSELGPLIEVVEAIGRPALEAAIPHLDARYPAHRFAAAFLFGAVPDERAIELLRPRLHDSEPRIRRVAAAALSHFVAHKDFDSVVTHLRQRLTSAAPETRQRAVWFLGYFRDVGSVPQLIALLDDHAEVAKASRSALKQITLQDLGPLSKAWEKWWKRARKKSRIDWLIEGLRSRDRDLRYIASIELSRLSGESFGYRCDDPKRTRDQAIKGFESWWDGQQTKLRANA